MDENNIENSELQWIREELALSSDEIRRLEDERNNLKERLRELGLEADKWADLSRKEEEKYLALTKSLEESKNQILKDTKENNSLLEGIVQSQKDYIEDLGDALVHEREKTKRLEQHIDTLNTMIQNYNINLI